MKTQDFLKALGGVSQDKLDALAEWQNAQTPITDEEPAKNNRITRTAAEPVPIQKRSRTMQQNTKKHAAFSQFFPWNIGIGAAIAACAIFAVSVGKEAIGQKQQMQAGTSSGTSASEQNAETGGHKPVEIIDQLHVTLGGDLVMMQIPPEGTVQVMRSAEDGEACGLYTDLFSYHDVLFFTIKDYQPPENLYTCDLAGASIAADGTTLKLDIHALVYDPAYMPASARSSRDENDPDWNNYFFYTVPKDSLPDFNAIEISYTEYPLGEIPDEILAHADDPADSPDSGFLLTKHTIMEQYLETTAEYYNYISSIPNPRYITWETAEGQIQAAESSHELPEDCTEARTISDYSTAQTFYDNIVNSEEWQKTESRQKRGEMLELPEEMLECLTTDALLQAVLDYPFMFDVYAYDDPQMAMGRLYESFNGLRELAKRPDAGTVLVQKYKQEKPDLTSALRPLIDLLASQDYIESKLTDAEKETLAALRYGGKNTEKNSQQSDQEIAELFAMLDNLRYHANSCDGLPSHKLTAMDGAVYCLYLPDDNTESGWVWRRPSLIADADNEAALTAEVIDAIRANRNSLNIEKLNW